MQMLVLIEIQIKLLLANASQFIYLLFVCLILGVFFALFSPIGKQVLLFSICIISSSQLAPKLFSLERENKTFESLLALPVCFRMQMAARKWFYFIITCTMIAISYIVMDAVKLANGASIKEDIGTLKQCLSFYVLPLITVYVLGLKMGLLSLKARESRVCAMDAGVAAIVYGMPCLIQMLCADQAWLAWEGVVCVYLVVEGMIAVALISMAKKYNDVLTFK